MHFLVSTPFYPIGNYTYTLVLEHSILVYSRKVKARRNHNFNNNEK